MTVTPKMLEHLRKIAAAEDAERERLGRAAGFPGRAIAMILWPDSEGWKKVSRRHSTPAGGAMGATMPMKGARAAWDLTREGLLYGDSNRHHQMSWRLSERGRRYLADHPDGSTT